MIFYCQLPFTCEWCVRNLDSNIQTVCCRGHNIYTEIQLNPTGLNMKQVKL